MQSNPFLSARDYNMWAVFIHYLGDAISSALVLGTGVLMHFFGDKKWIVYADPVSRYDHTMHSSYCTHY
jgi:Co/Zn/Cd efflux system component